MGQKEQILAYLKKGKVLTAMGALELCGSSQFGTRIHELRARGHEIESKLVKRENGKRSSDYWLKKCDNCGRLDPSKNPDCNCRPGRLL